MRIQGKIVKVGDQYAVKVPKKHLQHMGLKIGDAVNVTNIRLI